MAEINQSALLDSKRSVVNAHILLSVAQANGMTLAQVVENCSLSGQELRSAASMISARDELQMIRNILARKPLESGIGLAVGAKYHLAAFGVWGFALANSATVGEAAALALAHSGMTFAFSRLSIEHHDDKVHWYFDDVGMPADLKMFSIEREMVALGTVSHDLLGAEFEALEIWLSYPEPEHAALYSKYFNGPLRFSAPRNGFILPATLLTAPLNVPDEVLKNAESTDFRADGRALSDRIRDVLLANIKTLPSMEKVAGELYVSVRTLRRKLDAEGVTFSQLVDEVRCERAKELLEFTSMTSDDIARKLSYADASSFGQAFRRLTGETPAAYRQAKRQTPR